MYHRLHSCTHLYAQSYGQFLQLNWGLGLGFRYSFCVLYDFSPNLPKPPISDDIDGISKHRLSPITPTLKHDNTQRFPVQVLLIYDFYVRQLC